MIVQPKKTIRASLVPAAMFIIILVYASAAGAVSIKDLPDKGGVTISGTVAEVKDKHHFVLQDAEGKTIDVKSKEQITLKEGQSVIVNGDIQSNMLGLSKEITEGTVAYREETGSGNGGDSPQNGSRLKYN